MSDKENMDIMQSLPKLDNLDSIHADLIDIHTVCYVDNFFYYLASKILHSHDFLHGIDYYGLSCLEIKFLLNSLNEKGENLSKERSSIIAIDSLDY